MIKAIMTWRWISSRRPCRCVESVCQRITRAGSGESIVNIAGCYVKMEMFSEALARVEEYESWTLLAGSSSEADNRVEAMRKYATERLARQRKITKLKEKKAAKKGEVVKVTAEMVAESDKHAAELLEIVWAF